MKSLLTLILLLSSLSSFSHPAATLFRVTGDTAMKIYESLSLKAIVDRNEEKKSSDYFECSKYTYAEGEKYICDIFASLVSYESNKIEVVGVMGSDSFYKSLKHDNPQPGSWVGRERTEIKSYDGFKVERAIGAWSILTIEINN